jgi:hypothetical protein
MIYRSRLLAVSASSAVKFFIASPTQWWERYFLTVKAACHTSGQTSVLRDHLTNQYSMINIPVYASI